MIKNPSGRMVPRNPNMVLPNSQSQCQSQCQSQAQSRSRKPVSNYNPQPVNNNREIIQKNILSYPVAEFISALVIQKRNVYLESQNYSDVESNDVYDIISLHNNYKNGLVEYLNYKPVSNSEWKPVAKYLKKVQYNVTYKIEECETLEKCDL
jgi:hypothetical protein